MFKRHIINSIATPVACLCGLGASVSALLADGSTKGSDLKGYVAQWVQVQRDLGEEELRWKRDAVILKDSAAALKVEIESLQDTITKAEKEIAGFDEASAQDLEKKKGYENARMVLADKLPVLEKRLLDFKRCVPDFALRNNAKLRAALESIKTSSEENKANALNGRLADIVNALAELEKLQQTVTLQEELMQIDGEEKKVSVVYFGLACAYAANQSGSVAAVGSIDPAEGWLFKSSPEMAQQIVQLIQVAKGEGEVDFTSLPVSIQSLFPAS
ncbi:MAG: DUF3450 family protein [Akkermansiaceae bacterium]